MHRMSTSPKILLLCSGRLAVPALHQLAALGALAGVAVPYTDPKASSLFQQLTLSLDCPFHTLSRDGLTAQLSELHARYGPDAVFVIGFPWRIPESLLSLPAHGFFNFHGGPLPDLRGPDPLFEAIRQELAETALTIHRIDAELDAGPVVYEDYFPLAAGITHGLLSTQLALRSAQAIPVLLERIRQRTLSFHPQSPASGGYYRRAAPADLYIRWQSQRASAVEALIRACNPVYGGAAVVMGGWTLRLTDAAVLAGVSHNALPGTLLELSVERGALIQCLDDAVLQVFVIGTDEGYFPAFRLHHFGLAPGCLFESPSVPTQHAQASSLLHPNFP